jgi:hypothetical protein
MITKQPSAVQGTNRSGTYLVLSVITFGSFRQFFTRWSFKIIDYVLFIGLSYSDSL